MQLNNGFYKGQPRYNDNTDDQNKFYKNWLTLQKLK